MRQNLVFSVNFSITGKGKENQLLSLLSLPEPWRPSTGRGTMGASHCGRVARNGSQPGGQEWKPAALLPKADEHAASTGFYKMLPSFPSDVP